ncbi:Metal-dependent hydrolase, endonuclease/exonuclease/phosphatase family [Arthrobacter subterraneus]|uniref:Metal-dependent hydrolase, endonuclease/exonuclease/phosphatase family n=1 Tax=Arthrobacter subterraneus TaxID=335973 RepID=A0A1G8LFW0_9MICC|nr:endonuclease/exonuclease/phosphatase family protein [Arthrobacter subterraneus]SDI54090.1 Metal-dependent hydrolase, endonuclease/exonuclease/phosphatase family [Arthrobacter subterraneus]
MRFVVMTHNIWADTRWPEREPALRSLLRTRRPDIYAVQELRPATKAVIDEVLSGHSRVEDSERGWTYESSIWWDSALFTEVEHGSIDIGIGVDEIHRDRKLFWVRLAAQDGSTVVVSTAHFCFPGTQRELTEHVNPRIAQSAAAGAVLAELGGPEEPVLFMGDLNESWHVLRVLHEAGLQDSYSALGVVPAATWPTIPTWPQATAPWVIDFHFFRGRIRALTTEVVDFFEGDIAPSDHKPVVTTYGLDIG